MATKTIKAWINGTIQYIEVEDIVSPEQPISVEKRVDTLEGKHEIVFTDGNLLVGNGTVELEEMTPEDVLSHINGASVVTLTTAEYEALGDNVNANTLYIPTDSDNVDVYVQNDEPTEAEEGALWLDMDELGDAFEDYATKTYVTTKIAEAQLSGSDIDLSDYATKDDIPTKTSELTNDSGYITGYTETDPTVPAWAKASAKPTYTASEVGLGNVDNVKQYSASNPPPYPVTTVNGKTGAVMLDADAVGARASTWMPSASDVGALPDTTEIPTVPTNVSAFTNDAGYLTEHQSLDGYAKTADLGTLAAKDTVSKTDLSTDIQTSLGKADSALQSFTETDPTVPSWAKESAKPTYTASEVGADASGTANSLISTHNTATDAHADIREQISQISLEIADKEQLSPEFAESLEWLETNGDQTKLYVLPDGFIYAYMLTEVEAGPSYTNVLPLAINADGTPYVGTNGEAGYKTGYRLNSSRIEVAADGKCCTGFIPVKNTDTVRVKNIKNIGNANGYFHFYGSDFTSNTGMAYEPTGMDGSEWSFVPGEVKTNWPSNASLNTNASDKTAYMRISTGKIDETSIITINEEIVEGGGTTTEYAWASTGHAFVPADYEDRIIALEEQVEENTSDIANLKKGIASTTDIAEWDAPIYDANIPVFQLTTEKAAMTDATKTPDNIYAMYDALMARHPTYITKTDLGLCSDGVNHVYRYDFREPDPHYESGKVWSETKTKAILMTGVHFEWAGIYSLYYALEEIADNPELRSLRRNTHLIVVPVANPYATIADNYQSGLSTPNSYGVRNANGVEIHRNFEVDWVLTEEGSTHYGGAEPLSEVETQYIDQIMRDNTDAALFLSAHNCGVDTFWGTGFIWSSTATKYMCNMGFRLVDKMSDAWMEKYGDILLAGIEEYKTELLEDGDTRLGWAGLSSSPGTEAKQATKYGIQGTNIETCNPFQIHGTKANPEPSMSSFTMSRGAEVYVNFLLTAFGVYDPKDKKEYEPATV